MHILLLTNSEGYLTIPNMATKSGLSGLWEEKWGLKKKKTVLEMLISFAW